MLVIPGSAGRNDCDRVTRRDLLRVGGSGILGITLGQMFALQARANNNAPIPADAITGGGPVDATTTLAPAIYMQAFRFFNFGYAGAFAVIGFLISAVATLAFVVVQQRLAREP